MSYTIEEFDVVKTKVLKYVIYKKRTENEVYMKFKGQIDENILEDVIEEYGLLSIYLPLEVREFSQYTYNESKAVGLQ